MSGDFIASQDRDVTKLVQKIKLTVNTLTTLSQAKGSTLDSEKTYQSLAAIIRAASSFDFDASENIDSVIDKVKTDHSIATAKIATTLKDKVSTYISTLNAMITSLSYNSYQAVEDFSSRIKVASDIVFTPANIANLESEGKTVVVLVEEVLRLAGLLNRLTPEQQALCDGLKARNVVIYGPVNRLSRFSNSRKMARKMFEFLVTPEELIERKRLSKDYGMSTVRDSTAVIRRRVVSASGVGSINPTGFTKTNKGETFFCKLNKK